MRGLANLALCSLTSRTCQTCRTRELGCNAPSAGNKSNVNLRFAKCVGLLTWRREHCIPTLPPYLSVLIRTPLYPQARAVGAERLDGGANSVGLLTGTLGWEGLGDCGRGWERVKLRAMYPLRAVGATRLDGLANSVGLLTWRVGVGRFGRLWEGLGEG